MERPNNIGDQNAIDIAIIGAEVLGVRISDATARTIAAQWDAGARSDMHSFVTTGRIGEGLLDEIQVNYNSTPEDQVDDRRALRLLYAYADTRTDKAAQQGWSRLWLGKGPNEEEDSCAACGEHFGDPHAPDCRLNRGEGDE